MATISACMIVRNEEKRLPTCFASIRGHVDEIVCIDTGSVDRTKAIVTAEKNAIWLSHKWQNDFSEARNYAIKACAMDWIFIIDADEYVAQGHWDKVASSLDNQNVKAIMVDVLNLYDNEMVTKNRLTSIRFFRNHTGFYYRYPVHNQLVTPENINVDRVDFHIMHTGYDLSPIEMAEKTKRAVPMCRRFAEDNPRDPLAWFNLTQALRSAAVLEINSGGKTPMALLDSALDANQKAIDLLVGATDQKELHLALWVQRCEAYYIMGRHSLCREAAVEALMIDPINLDAIFLMAVALYNGGALVDAEIYFRRYIQIHEGYDWSRKTTGMAVMYANQRSFCYNMLSNLERKKEELLTLSSKGVPQQMEDRSVTKN